MGVPRALTAENYSCLHEKTPGSPCLLAMTNVFTTIFHVYTGMPENITFNATSSRSMILSWDPPGEGLRNGTIQRYSIICSSDDHVGFYLQHTIPVSSQSILMTGLNPFISYNCCIATITTNGNGPYRCDAGITLQDGKLDYHLFIFSQESVDIYPMVVSCFV